MAISQNGYPVLPNSSDCARWSIPVKGDERHLFLRPGHAGFVLACLVAWFHRAIAPINKGTWDEWGWAYRAIRGQDSGFSNHASGTAVDINATEHPLGRVDTYTDRQVRRIHRRLKLLRGIIRWGGDYCYRKDEMHFELVAPITYVIPVARLLRFTPVGRAVVKANPHYHPRWRD